VHQRSQGSRGSHWRPGVQIRSDLIIPNPKLSLMEQVRECMRPKHNSICTEGAIVIDPASNIQCQRYRHAGLHRVAMD